MLRKLIGALVAGVAFMGAAMAVDVNQATRPELESIRGIGPSTASRILDERKKGPYKDWNEFESRVKGVGESNAAKFSEAGLTVNGQPKAGVATKSVAAKKDAVKKEEKVSKEAAKP